MNDQELRDLERRRLASLVAADSAISEAMHAEDYELIPPTGEPVTGRQYLDWIASGEIRYEIFEPASPIRVLMLGSGGGVVRYQARIVIHSGDWTDRLLAWHTDIYALRDGRWQAVWSQATRIKDLDEDSSS